MSAGTDASDAMVSFSIAPTDNGVWLWRTSDQHGQPRAQGLAATRKQAAALVIRDIILARAEAAAPHILLPAKAA